MTTEAAPGLPAPPEELPRSADARGKVLVVDDQRNMRATTAIVLRSAGHTVDEAEDGAAALQRIRQEAFDVVLTDLRMPNGDGMELLREAQRLVPETQVIVMTAYGTIESAVEAIRRGAYDFLAKPFKEDELLLRVAKALEKRRLLGEVSLLAGEFRRRYGLEHIVGRSAAMQDLLERVVRVAPTDATVLISGESGTGKELVARALHVASRRGARAVHPGELRRDHRDPARVRALRTREGLLHRGDAGAARAVRGGPRRHPLHRRDRRDEPGVPGEAPARAPGGEIRRVGESTPVQVDVRVIAATNQDLRRAVTERRFREDLYYRLAVVPIRIPPLRERREDVPLLAAHFLARFARRTGALKTLSSEAVARLVEHAWPGNVRELENVIEQAAALSPNAELRGADVQVEPHGAPLGEEVRTLAATVEDAERHAIEAALARAAGDLPKVARDLAVSATTLWRKMKRLGL